MNQYFDENKFWGDWEGMGRELKEGFVLYKLEEVKKYVPVSAQYVTLAVSARIIDDKQLQWHKAPMRTSRIPNQKGISSEVYLGYLSHDGQKLSFVSPSSTFFSIPLSQITDVREIQLANDWSLVISTARESFLVGDFVQIQTGPNSTYKTSPKVTDATFGWYKELARLGVVSDKRQRQHSRTNFLFTILFISAVIFFIWIFFFYKH